MKKKTAKKKQPDASTLSLMSASMRGLRIAAEAMDVELFVTFRPRTQQTTPLLRPVDK